MNSFNSKIRSLRAAFQARNAMPCVGLVVLAGCFTFVIAPDELPTDSKAVGGPTRFPMIVLDPGHGGNDAGGRGNGLVEKEITLDVAKRTEQLLTQSGFMTVLTREKDDYLSLEERATKANSYDDAVFVSIHFNLDRSSESSGVESYYARQKYQPVENWAFIGLFETPEADFDTGEDLAGFIQNAVSTRTEARNRGIRAGNLYVVRNVKWPAVLVEGGFMSNPMEAQLLANGDYRDRMARGIAEGVMTYLKSRPAPTEDNVPKIAQVMR